MTGSDRSSPPGRLPRWLRLGLAVLSLAIFGHFLVGRYHAPAPDSRGPRIFDIRHAPAPGARSEGSGAEQPRQDRDETGKNPKASRRPRYAALT